MDEATQPPCYEIHIRGELSETTLGAFPRLHVSVRDSVTVLTGELADQSALHGALAQIEALNLELLKVLRINQTTR